MKKLWYKLVLGFNLAIFAIFSTVPVNAFSDFYSDSDVQFYDPNACDPRGGSTSTNQSSDSSSQASDVTSVGPIRKKAYPDDKVKVGYRYRGKASTYANDKKEGIIDHQDNNIPALQGASNDNPGIAVYNTGTLGGWWEVTAPNDKVGVIQQTDYGPSTSRTVDINAVAARSVFGYKGGNKFPTDEGDWTIKYLGKKKPNNAITKDSGGSGDAGTASTDVDATGGNCVCNDGNNTSTLAGRNNEEKIWNYFIAKDLKPAQIAGIMGNMSQESGFDPQKVEGGSRSKTPASVGWGLIQWTPGTKIVGIARQAKITGPIYELPTQLDIVWWHMRKTSPTGVINMLKNYKKITDVTQATTVWEDQIEGAGIPMMANRIAAAKAALRKYGSNTSGNSTVLTGSSGEECSGSAGNAGENGWELTGKNAMVFYDQCNSRWGDEPYGYDFDEDGEKSPKTTICEAGCGIASLAMIVSTFKTKKTPKQLSDRYGNKYHTKGTSWSLWPVAAKDYGLKMTDLGTDLNKAKSIIKSGGLVLISVDPGEFTSQGHFMIIRAVDNEGNFYLADPNNKVNKSRGIGDTNKKAYSAEFLRNKGALKHLWGWQK